MKKKIKILTFFLSLPSLLIPQESQPEMADFLRESGKINAVVAVLAVIFAGMAVYLWMIDRKITRIEKELDNNNPK